MSVCGRAKTGLAATAMANDDQGGGRKCLLTNTRPRPGVLMMAVTVGENGSLERKRTSALWFLGTPSHVDSCGLFDLDQTKTLQRSNFYAPNVRLGMERTLHLHRLTLSGVEHDHCP